MVPNKHEDIQDMQKVCPSMSDIPANFSEPATYFRHELDTWRFFTQSVNCLSESGNFTKFIPMTR